MFWEKIKYFKFLNLQKFNNLKNTAVPGMIAHGGIFIDQSKNMIVSDVHFLDVQEMLVIVGSLFSVLTVFKNSIGSFIMRYSFNKKLVKIVRNYFGDHTLLNKSPQEILDIMRDKLSYSEVFATLMQVDKQKTQIENILS